MKKTIQLDTCIQDGMYMDIHSIEFGYDPQEFKNQVEKALKLIEDNKDLISSVKLQMFTNKAIQSTKWFNSTIDDEEKTEDVESRIDAENISIYPHGIWYRGYSKWSSDFLEVCLDELLED